VVHVHLGVGGEVVQGHLGAGEVRAGSNHGAGVGGVLGGMCASVYGAGAYLGAGDDAGARRIRVLEVINPLRPALRI